MKKNKKEELEEELDKNEEEKETTKDTKKAKDIKPIRQKEVSDAFTEAIKKYLDDFSSKDDYFAKCYSNPNKSIVECCAYIVGQAMKLGVKGMADEEVYQLARHYYLEEISPNDLQVKYEPNRVITNTHIELSEKEKAEAKEQALKEYKEECLQKEKDRIAKAEANRKKKEEEKKKKQLEEPLGGLLELF